MDRELARGRLVPIWPYLTAITRSLREPDVLVLYRVGNGFARPAGTPEASFPGIDSRFDVQVRQSLPFMNFSSAKWEMLLAVRNFFRESGSEQSVLDERVSVRPPKRVVGGVTLRF